jgi:hypothetical protein
MRTYNACRDAAACQIYQELVGAAAPKDRYSTGSSANEAMARPVTGPLPWLYYVAGSNYLSAEDIDLQ